MAYTNEFTLKYDEMLLETSGELLLGEAFVLFENKLSVLVEQYKSGEITEEEFHEAFERLKQWWKNFTKSGQGAEQPAEKRTPEEELERRKEARRNFRAQGREKVIHRAADMGRKFTKGENFIS